MIDETKLSMRIISNNPVPAFIRDIVSANIIEVEAGTNGLHGGDSGHGSRTYIRIEDIGGTDITVTPTFDNRGVEIILGGDCELNTIIDALKFVVKVLKQQRKASVAYE